MLMNVLSLTEIQQDSRSANLLEASFIKFEISLLEDIGYSSHELLKFVYWAFGEYFLELSVVLSVYLTTCFWSSFTVLVDG